ncbi:MAG: hypothetical protein H6732_00760 [Alphaproteobacteria bacterium]|nr:hypothetical protein [Alphaproteobacteria bacterium]
MDDSLTAYLLVALAGLLCLAAAVILGVVLVMVLRRQPQEGGSTGRAPVNPGGGGPARAPVAGRPASLPPMDDGLSEDELPTVVVSTPPTPPRPAPEPHRPAALGDAPLSPAPQRRSSGATIIAFDDEEEDDDQ